MSHRMEMNDLCDRIMNERSAPRVLDDSDRNILASLRHEACEAHCEACGACVGEGAELVALGPSGGVYHDVLYKIVGDHVYCGDCA